MSTESFNESISENKCSLENSHLTDDLFSKNFKIVTPSSYSLDNDQNIKNVSDNIHEFDYLEKQCQNVNIYQKDSSNIDLDQSENKANNINENLFENLEKDINESTLTSNISSYLGLNKIANYFSLPDILENKNNNENNLNNFILQNANLIHHQDNNLEPSVYDKLKPHWFFKAEYNEKDTNVKNLEKSSNYFFVKNYIFDFKDEFQKVNKNNFNESNENWLPFSIHDSEALESAYQNLANNPNIIVSTNGDKYDCYIKERYKKSIYWEEKHTPIRRCTWYYKKEGCNKFIPYNEQFAENLENIYYDVVTNKKWNQRIELNLNNQEIVIFYSSKSMIHYQENTIKDDWNIERENPVNLRILTRELNIEELNLYDEFIDNDEMYKVDHLVFLVHGVGEICDMRFRSIKEVVDDFRKISLNLTRKHFRSHNEKIGRTEFIPIYWHEALHGNQTGIDSRLKLITLPSIPKLRSFANDTILDALFYLSPVYCQTIINTVANEINRLYALFLKRNSYFQGSVSLSGHSLGSVILFDLLANQEKQLFNNQEIKNSSLSLDAYKSILDSFNNVNIGQINITYPKLNFKPECFFALGSPISMFLTLKGICSIDENFILPNCKNVFNIFHPFDPIAYRIEPLINKEYANIMPVIIPHHKGRKRMHLQIKENILKMSSEFKEKVFSGIKTTWESVNNIVRIQNVNFDSNKEFQFKEKNSSNESLLNSCNSIDDQLEKLNKENVNLLKLGSLNNGKRIDYVLQEKPIEFFNQYIFAFATHACYWMSEDTCLFMLKELYKLNGIHLECKDENSDQSKQSSNLENSFC